MNDERASRVRLVPLGGLGEIGMNCLALEQEDGILVVDCGTSFPHEDLGIDVIHPDFSYLFEHRERIAGVFLTHGHEDHIGGLPYLLAELEVPVYGPTHALSLARRRLSEHGFENGEADLRPAQPGKRYELGPFEIEPVRVAHSIVDATALCIATAAGTVLHTGDFNLESDPPDGEPTDEGRLREIGDAGVRLLLSDSTNVDVPERSGSERAVGAALDGLIRQAGGRVFVVMFASNVQRLLLLEKIARATGRKICLLGRSLTTHVEVAREIGRLAWPSDLLIAPEALEEWPRDQVLILAGGTQAEPSSAMRRIAAGTHTEIGIEKGDTVIFSSRVIPGNERPVNEMVCDLLRAGAKVHTRHTDPLVHTSGHASRSEQKRMIDLLRPQGFVPVHGSLHHLLAHERLAREAGVSDSLVLENGHTAVVNGVALQAGRPVTAGKVPIANGGEPLSYEVLRKRRELARAGLVAVTLVLDARGRVSAGPELQAWGVAGLDGNEAELEALRRELAAALAGMRGNGDPSDRIRRALRRRVLEISGSRPAIEVQILKG